MILKGDLGTRFFSTRFRYKGTHEKKRNYQNEYDCNSRQSFKGFASKEKINMTKLRAC